MEGKKQKSQKYYYFLARSRDAWDEEKIILVGIEVAQVKTDGSQMCGM